DQSRLLRDPCGQRREAGIRSLLHQEHVALSGSPDHVQDHEDSLARTGREMNPETILVAKVVFWLSLGLVIYPYVLYPLVLFLTYSVTQAWRDLRYLGSPCNRRTETPVASGLPGVSLIVPAHNEEKVLPAKIENLRELDFPRDRLQVIFVSDGSEDGTNQILQNLREENYQCILLQDRKGKANALNHAVQRASNE